jgi:hypothetical protein
LGLVIAYCVFYLLPQSLVLFGPFLGLTAPGGTGSLFMNMERLLIPAAVIGVAYPLAVKTKYEGVMAAALGFSIIIFLLYLFGGGSVTVTTIQTSATGLQMSVNTSVSFTPLLCLVLVPIGVFTVKGCYLSYGAMKGSPGKAPSDPDKASV